MTLYIAIAIGGALGAVCRYWVSTSTYAWLGAGFPYGTLMVNVSGSFIMGFLVIVLSERLAMPEELKLALLVGFLGSYTTFSAFALDSLNGVHNGAVMKIGLYILLSVTGSLLGVWLGYLGGKFLVK